MECVRCGSAAMVEGSLMEMSGGGAFPDDYPGRTLPIPGSVHIPNIYMALDARNGELPDMTHPDFVQMALGLDNAVSRIDNLPNGRYYYQVRGNGTGSVDFTIKSGQGR